MAKNHTAVFLYKGKKITAINTIAVITALSGFLELTVVKLRIESVLCKKLIVCTLQSEKDQHGSGRSGTCTVR